MNTNPELDARLAACAEEARKNLREFQRTKDPSHVKRLVVSTDVYDYIFRDSKPNEEQTMPRLGLVELDIDENDRVSSMGVEEDKLLKPGTMEFRGHDECLNGMLINALFNNRHAKR